MFRNQETPNYQITKTIEFASNCNYILKGGAYLKEGAKLNHYSNNSSQMLKIMHVMVSLKFRTFLCVTSNISYNYCICVVCRTAKLLLVFF